MLVAAKVRDTIPCSQCLRPRCIYSMAKISKKSVQSSIKRRVEENSYCCGEALFPEGHELRKSVVVRQELDCAINMESCYYSAATVTLPAVCCYCGSSSGSPIYQGEGVADLKRKFSKVRPICTLCFTQGKEPVTWGATNFFSKKKKI